MKKFIAFLSIILISIISAVTLGPILDVNPIIPGIASFVVSFIPLPVQANCLYGLAFTAAGGVGTPFLFNIPYLPEILHWNDAAAPLVNLRITTKEEGTLHDWNAAAIAAMNGYLKVGVQAANDVTVLVASGHLNRQCTISGTTSAVGAINFYTSSDNKGKGMNPVPYMTQMETNIALTPSIYQNFAALFIPTMATLTDYADIEYNDAHKERMEIQDLIARSTDFQQVAAIIINNIGSEIHRVSLRTLAATPIYILKYYIRGQ